MRRKLVCLIFTFLLLMTVCISALAATGTVRIDIGGKGEITLYSVGKAEGDGYRLSESYGGGFVTFDDILSPDLAAWLAQRGKNGISQETEQGSAAFTGVEEGLYLVVQTGEREGYYAFNPFLISMPWDGNMWEIDASPKMEQRPTETPQTGEDSGLVPAIGAMILSAIGLAGCGYIKRPCR